MQAGSSSDMSAKMPESEAEWEAYWEIGASGLSFERGMKARGYRTISNWADKRGTAIETPSDQILSLYRKVYGDELLAVGVSLLKRLRGTIWRTQIGVELTVEEMTLSHASNLKRWLERRATLIHLAAQLEAECAEADHDGGEHAHDAIEEEARQLRDADSLDVLRELPLYQAIVARVKA